jgi:hypothetical protein
MLDLPFSYKWVTLSDRDGVEYEFPRNPRPFLPGRYQGYPGVYRWRVVPTAQSEPKRVLIGESGNLRTRLNQYVHPNNPEMKTWNQVFRKHHRLGARVQCQLLTFEPFTIRGACVSPDSVSGSPFVRRLVENLMIMLSPEEMDTILLNKDGGRDRWTRRS